MDLSIEKPDVEWYNAMSGKGGIYDLANAAAFGAGKRERLRAVIALGESDDPRAVRPLMDLLSDGDPEIRVCATSALGTLKSGRAVEALIGRLRDRGEQISTRQQAAAALAAIRSTGALRGLKEFIADEDEDPALRSYAGSMLGRSGTW
jgi:HEAT repeat protein